jgi:hypothetical protein
MFNCFGLKKTIKQLEKACRTKDCQIAQLREELKVPDLCVACCARFPNAGFLHLQSKAFPQDTVHGGWCLKCAEKWHLQGKPCPCCNSQFWKVIIVYVPHYSF